MGSVAVSGDRRRLWRSRWAAIGAAVAVTLGGGGIFVANAASSVPSSVVTIDPVRILDTRDPVNVGLPGPFVSAVSQKLQVTGAAVPTGATGVLLNVTVVGPTANGFLSIRPGDATGAASTSSLNFNAGQTVPNSVQVGLPTAGANAGTIDITYDAYGQAGPTTEVLIDVVGYMIAGVGAVGPAGPTGATGATGATGPRGISAFDTLPAFQTVTGEVDWRFNATLAAQFNRFSVDFPAKGTRDLLGTEVEFGANAATGDASTACTGTFAAPTAPAGLVCLYIGTATINANNAFGNANLSQKRSGFSVEWVSPAAGSTGISASWAYTPPLVLVILPLEESAQQPADEIEVRP